MSAQLIAPGGDPTGRADRPVTITVDGTELTGVAGQSIAGVLLTAGRVAWRYGRTGAGRGVFCGIGACFDCLVTVDGVPDVRACRRRARDGDVVTTQTRQPSIMDGVTPSAANGTGHPGAPTDADDSGEHPGAPSDVDGDPGTPGGTEPAEPPSDVAGTGHRGAPGGTEPADDETAPPSDVDGDPGASGGTEPAGGDATPPSDVDTGPGEPGGAGHSGDDAAPPSDVDGAR